MKKYEEGNENGRFYMIAIAVVAPLLIGALLFLFAWEKQQGAFPSGEISCTFEYNNETYILKDGVETLLVLGLDTFENDSEDHSYNNDQQADFLMLFVIDHRAKTVQALHINRDTMTEVDILGLNGNRVDTATMQIALSHTYGNGKEISCHNAANAVSGLLMNIGIDHCISVKMDAVPIFNDFVGGVELTLTEDFTDLDRSMVKGETILLRGEQALYYVRGRYGPSDSGNVSRMERQRQYLNALYERMTAVMDENESFVTEAFLKMGEYIVSDCSAAKLQSLGESLRAYAFVGIRTLDGTYRNGAEYVEFYPTEESVRKNTIELFYIPED